MQETKQVASDLEATILQSTHHSYQTAKDKIDLQLDAIYKHIKKLEKTPDFFSRQEQSILISKLETNEILLTSQADLIQQLKDENLSLNNSCQYIYKFESEFNQKAIKLATNLSNLKDSLLDSIALYCYEENSNVILNIETQIKEIESLLKEEKLTGYDFLAMSLVEHANNILVNQQKINKINLQLKTSSLEEKLLEFENLYLETIDFLDERIQTYRFFSYLFSLIVVIFIAYQVINNLTQTNRNIVKILEGFTQELETKVEQRTALLEESIQNTEAALAQAQNANKAKSRFLANMSHELRTPLNAILGFTQLMCRDSSVSKEHQENIQIINRSGEHLLKLINDILEMSKIEVGQITLNEAKFDLYVMLQSIEEMLCLKAKVKNLRLTFDIAKNVPRYIYTDEGKLRQIIINLLGNALKFTNKGEIALKVKLKDNTQLEEANIDFLFTDTHLLYFAVTDTGPGISDDEMDRLFSPFEQTKIGRISNEGTGLGLSICQKFVELMGGKLEVSSAVGKGSTFSFGILIKLEDINLSSTVDTKEIDETRRVVGIVSNQPQYRILAVDDVPASRLLLKKMLTEIGFAVEEAGDGKQAVDLFSSWHPNLILMDMRMPIMDGYEATKRIKSLPKGQETIIIALTASAFEEERVIILSAGCDDFMRKPFYANELIEKIGQYLNIDYVYQEAVDITFKESEALAELSHESLEVMPMKWRSQLYDAAARVDNQEILQLLSDIPQEYESLAKGLENLVEHFRCDKIIDLT
ncbi:MAG: ATP-binding protein [Pleurocapsa sp.]